MGAHQNFLTILMMIDSQFKVITDSPAFEPATFKREIVFFQAGDLCNQNI